MTLLQEKILHLYADGDCVKEIAPKVQRAVKTVEHHLQRLRDRHHAKTTTHLIVLLHRQGILSL